MLVQSPMSPRNGSPPRRGLVLVGRVLVGLVPAVRVVAALTSPGHAAPSTADHASPASHRRCHLPKLTQCCRAGGRPANHQATCSCGQNSQSHLCTFATHATSATTEVVAAGSELHLHEPG